MRIGVDLGGTNVRVGLVDGNHIVKMVAERCKADRPEQEVIDHIVSLIGQVMTPEVERIGIGVPSVVDSQQGIVYNVIGIPSWHEVHLKSIMEQRFGIPVAVNNDCNCFAMGVSKFSNMENFHDVVCLALGTGVGAGILINGELYCGQNTGAGEFGSIPYLDRDYEYYCSSRYFVGLGTTGKEAYEKAMTGDREALKLWREFGVHVGNLVQAVLYTYDPQEIVFGGSIAAAFDLFEKSMYEQLTHFPYAKTVARLRICCSNIEHIGVLGASAL